VNTKTDGESGQKFKK